MKISRNFYLFSGMYTHDRKLIFTLSTPVTQHLLPKYERGHTTK